MESLFKEMVKEWNLAASSVRVIYKDAIYCIAVQDVIKYVEESPDSVKCEVESVLKKINYYNDNLEKYIQFLALNMLKELKSEITHLGAS